MVTKEEWDELDRKVRFLDQQYWKQAAEKAKRAAEKIAEDAKVNPEDLRKPVSGER